MLRWPFAIFNPKPMENNTMKKIDAKSLQIFEDMKAGFQKWIQDQDDQYIINEDPLRYEMVMKFSASGEILWARYIPDCQYLYVGMTFPHKIPEEKIPFTLAYLNLQSYFFPLMQQSLQHLTLCPVCHRIDSIIGIPLIRERFPKGKFQILLTISKLMSNFGQYQATGAIANERKIVLRSLVSPLRIEFPDLVKYFGGGL